MRLILLMLTALFFVENGWGQWTEPELFPLEHGNAIHGPWISNDNLRMYAAFSGFIFVAERATPDSSWTAFHNVNNHINGASRQESPCESPSGDTLYFMAEGREPTFGWYDIYYSVKTDSGWWGPIVNCGEDINSEWMEWTVGISRDGTTLIVSSDRIPGGTLNLYYSEKLEDGNWGPLNTFGTNVNTWFDEEHGSLSADNTQLYFYRSGFRMGDVFVSESVDDIWQPAEFIPDPVTTEEWTESDPCFGPNDGLLYFLSDRDVPHGMHMFVTEDTTYDAVGPQPRPLPSALEPSLFAMEQEGILTLTVVGVNASGSFDVGIYDLLGRQVKREVIYAQGQSGTFRGQVRVDSLPSGTYLAAVQKGKTHISTTFTVIR